MPDTVPFAEFPQPASRSTELLTGLFTTHLLQQFMHVAGLGLQNMTCNRDPFFLFLLKPQEHNLIQCLVSPLLDRFCWLSLTNLCHCLLVHPKFRLLILMLEIVNHLIPYSSNSTVLYKTSSPADQVPHHLLDSRHFTSSLARGCHS